MENTAKAFRIEKDLLGEKEVPCEAYYGVQSLRAMENFSITGEKLNTEMINSLAILKKACAIANGRAGVFSNEKAKAISDACDLILEGKFHDQFIVDPLQGSAGTSINMNANEVIANVAIELLGGTKGDYSIVHPNDHVNNGQSTNDIIPTAGKMTTITLIEGLEKSLTKLQESFENKAKEFDHVLKMGRTQLQDAVPVRLGQEFHAYATSVARGIKRVHDASQELLTVNMGATAIGTAINANCDYFKNIVPTLCEVSGRPYKQAEDLIDGTQSTDCFAAVSSAVKNCAIALSKIANDLRLMSSGPKTGLSEINLPPRQNGSSIMPGKVNPVIPEVVSQVAFNIVGNDVTIAMAVEGGQLELNAFEPVTFYCLFSSIQQLSRAAETLRINCVDGITANEARCSELLDGSIGVVTALCPYIGYADSAAIAKQALRENIPVRKLILDKGIMTEERLKEVLDPYKMTEPAKEPFGKL